MTDVAEVGVRIDASGAKAGAKQVNAAVGSMRKQFVGLKGIVASLGIGLVFRKIIKDSAGFQQAIADLSAITGATGKDLKFLSDKAKEFGETTTLTASQAATAFKLIASAKPDLLENGAALAEVTKNAITLAEAAGTDLPTAAKTLGSVLNQFNASAEASARYMNVLAAGAKLGASEIPDTADAMQYAGTVAASMGISFEETNSAVQQLAKVSIKGTEAGAALRNVMLRLEASSDKNLRPSVVGLSGAINNLAKENLSATELNKKFGLRAITAAQQLINQKDALKELSDKLTDTTIGWEQAAIKVDTLEGDVKTLNSAIEAFSINTGDKANPALREIVQSITIAVRAWKEMSETTDGSTSTLQGFVSIVNFVLKTVNFAVFQFRIWGKTIGAVAASLAALARGDFKGIGEIWRSWADDSKKLGDEFKRFNKRLDERKQALKDAKQAAIDEMKAEQLRQKQIREAEMNDPVKQQQAREKLKAQATAAYKKELEKLNPAQTEYNKKLADYNDWLNLNAISQKQFNELKKRADEELAKKQPVDPMAEADMAKTEALKNEVLQFSASQKTQTQVLLDSLAERKAALEEAWGRDIIDGKVMDELKIKAAEDTQKRLTEIMKTGVVERNAFETLSGQQKTDVLLSQADKYLGGVAGKSKKAFEAQKAINIAQATMSTYTAATEAYKSLAGIPVVGPALGAAAAGLAIAAGLANIASIRSQQFKAYAMGGHVSGKDPILVGEKGPEIFMPNGSGHVVPNNKLAAGGGATVNNYFNISSSNGSIDNRSIQQIQAATAAALNRATQRNG